MFMVMCWIVQNIVNTRLQHSITGFERVAEVGTHVRHRYETNAKRKGASC